MAMNPISTATRHLLALACAAELLAGCANARHQPLPAVNLPAQWTAYDVDGTALASPGASAPSDAAPIPAEWWRSFGDPVLDQLIADALTVNSDLAVAAIRVYRAQLEAGLVATRMTPGVTLGATGSSPFGARQTGRTISFTGALNYELDLWGKLAAQRDAARWSAGATQADRDAIRLSLIGKTAGAYWRLGLLNQQIALGNENIAGAERALALVRTQHAAGTVSGLDVAQAELNVSTQRANQARLVQQRTEQRHALAILFNRPPQALAAEPASLPDQPPPAVPAGLPADLLSRRPDLREAELQLRASLANVDATRTSFYPSFTLTGSAGISSVSLAGVLSNPVATLSLALPFIQWNVMQLQIKVSQTRYEEAAVNFRQKLYAALGEVEDALSARVQLEREGEQGAQALVLAQRAEALARARFIAGATGVQQWLDQQQRRRDAQLANAQNRLERLNNRMKLYQALGGGDQWPDSDDKQSTGPHSVS
ncbi:efflux transporter outer membrane subunit [Cupriavidus sp. CP313]